ncbi:MAG: GDP-mannose 4,6-dehydratase [Methanothrix sp.]
MKYMRALITGCAGFIGSTLLDILLKTKFDVIGIDSFSNYYSREIKERNILDALNNKKFTFIEDDLLNIDEYPEVDYVFHLAAQAGVRASWGSNFEIYTKNNIEVTQRILESYINKKLKKFIYASSSSVYGDAALPMCEDALTRPVSPYGVSKLAGENLCYLYWKNYGIPAVSLRYFTVYGPRQRPDMAINKFIKKILHKDILTIFGDGKQQRDFTYVEDIVNATHLAAERACPGEVLNIGGGNKISVNDLIKTIERISGVQANIEYNPSQKGDVENTWADTSKAKKMLNWTPQCDLETGLKNYLRWLVNEQ